MVCKFDGTSGPEARDGHHRRSIDATGVQHILAAAGLKAKAFGINVVIIEPGAIRSEWAGIAEHLRRWLPDRTYDALIRRVGGMR